MPRSFGFVAVILVAIAAIASSASAAKPTLERITVDESFPDQFLTAECGFPVVTTALGHVIVREFEPEGTGPVTVLTVNIALTATANGKSVRFRDVGADLLRQAPSGDLILMIIGQLPFDFTGVLKINTTTGEVIHEPQHSTEEGLEELCAALSP